MAAKDPQPKYLPREIRLPILQETLYRLLVADIEKKAKEYSVPTIYDYAKDELYPSDTIPETIRIIHQFGLTACQELIDDVQMVIPKLSLDFQVRFEHEDQDVPGELFECNWSASDLSREDWNELGLEIYHLSYQQLSKLRRILQALPQSWIPFEPKQLRLLPTVASVRRGVRYKICSETGARVEFHKFPVLRETILMKSWNSSEAKAAAGWYARKLLKIGSEELWKVARDMNKVIKSRVNEATPETL